MHLSRFFWFLISILLGAAAGLVIAWYVRPTPMGVEPPTALRSDYRTDYVLMAAEAFDSDKDLVKASARLNFLGGDTPARIAQVAVIQAGGLGYDRRDLELLAKLAQALLAPSVSATPTLKTNLTPPVKTSLTPPVKTSLTPAAATPTGAQP